MYTCVCVCMYVNVCAKITHGIFSMIVHLEQAFVPYEKLISASAGPSCVQFPEAKKCKNYKQ